MISYSLSAHDSRFPQHFTIKHYAEPVTYNAVGFLEKNQDSMTLDVLKLISGSASELIRGAFYFELLLISCLELYIEELAEINEAGSGTVSPTLNLSLSPVAISPNSTQLSPRSPTGFGSLRRVPTSPRSVLSSASDTSSPNSPEIAPSPLSRSKSYRELDDIGRRGSIMKTKVCNLCVPTSHLLELRHEEFRAIVEGVSRNS